MKVLVTGDREFTGTATINLAFNFIEHTLGPISAVVHGAARGADVTAGMVALERGYRVVPVPAEWNRYGKGAGPRRNQRMLNDHPDIKVVLAFHKNLKASKGTKDMVSKALMVPLKVYQFTPAIDGKRHVTLLTGEVCPKCVTSPLEVSNIQTFFHENKVCRKCHAVWHKGVHY